MNYPSDQTSTGRALGYMAAAIRAGRRQVSTWGMAELAMLAIVLLASGALYLFAQIADEVVEGETRSFDLAVLMALRTPGDPDNALGPLWVELMFIDITALGGHTTLTLVTLTVIGFLLIERRRATALLVLVSVAGGALISHFAKIGFNRPRPELVDRLVEVHTLSFPSGHAMLSAVTYLTLGALLTRTSQRRAVRGYFLGVAVLLTLLIGASRVYLGVHYPTDVLAGWTLGSAWAMICWTAALWLQRRGQVEQQTG
jgi:undecaprenyl-diphosphatase